MAKAQPSPQEGSGLGERSHPEPQWEWGYKWVTCNQFPTHCLFPSSHRVKLSKSFPGLHNKASSLSGAVSSAHRSAKGAQLYPFLYRVPQRQSSRAEDHWAQFLFRCTAQYHYTGELLILHWRPVSPIIHTDCCGKSIAVTASP